MMNLSAYKAMLSSQGSNLSQIARNQSNVIMSETFCSDPTYKRVYILTPNGWKFEDAKYQFHTAQSILRDSVDYYLQFRPKTHYPIGSYVIIPDDTDSDINLTAEELRNPFLQPISQRTQWWLLVERDNANSFVRYNVLKCNWNFQWVYDGKIREVFGVARNANSYTSGWWRDEISTSLDNLTNAWLPNTHYVYGDALSDLGLDDSRTLMHGQRFFMTTNILEPKVYQTTKITELNPLGILKLSLKQDEYSEKRDNLNLMICDYYTDNGDIVCEAPVLIEPNDPVRDMSTSSIIRMDVNDAGEYVESAVQSLKLNIGTPSYFQVNFSQPGVDPEWKIQLNQNENPYKPEEISYWEGLVKLTKMPNNLLSIKLGKAGSLKGKQFILSVSDAKGDYYSSLLLEVSE